MKKWNGGLRGVFQYLMFLILTQMILGCGGTDRDTQAGLSPRATNPSEVRPDANWYAVWATAQTGSTTTRFDNQTLRLIVYPTGAGSKLRVKLRNFFGNDSVRIAAVAVSKRREKSQVIESSTTHLFFNGQRNFVLQPGEDLFSDSVNFDVQAFEDLAIDIFVEGPAAVSQDSAAYLTSYIGAPNSGNLVGQNSDEKFGTTITAMPLLEEVSVFSSEIEGTIVAVGGSVVDGVGSNVDQHNRWTDFLAARLVTQASTTKKLTVVNEGISGNTTQDVLDRFDRDILDKSGLSHVVIYAGTNDLSLPPPLGPTAEQIVDNFRLLIEKCHDADKKIIISTITPRLQYFPMSNEERKKVNDWVRRNGNCGGECDGIVDFDSVLSWSIYPNMIAPAFDSGDTVHPNGTGYKAMADSFNLSIFSL